MNKEIKETILIALYKYRNQLDLRIKFAIKTWAHLSQEEMSRTAQTGTSKQEFLDRYKSEADKLDSVIEWVKKNI